MHMRIGLIIIIIIMMLATLASCLSHVPTRDNPNKKLSNNNSTVTTAKPRAAHVIWLHGLGDSGAGWKFLQDKFATALPHVTWEFPTAPVKPVTLAHGGRMAAWFDITQFPVLHGSTDDETGLRESAAKMHGIIAKHIARGIPSQRILLGGFSQGGVMTALVAARANVTLAGAAVISGWVPMLSTLRKEVTEDSRKTPFAVFHGQQDNKVSFSAGEAGAKVLRETGFDVSFHQYPHLAHSVDDKLLADLLLWFKACLPP